MNVRSSIVLFGLMTASFFCGCIEQKGQSDLIAFSLGDEYKPLIEQVDGTEPSGYSIQQTNDSGYIVCGENLFDILLLKTDAVGKIIWEKNYTIGDWAKNYAIGESADIESKSWTGYRDRCDSVQEMSDGGYGLKAKTLGLGNKYWIKTDSEGNMLWERTFLETMDVGSSNEGGYILLIGGKGDMHENFLLKTSLDGNILWKRSLGQGFLYKLNQLKDGGYLLSGTSGELYRIPRENRTDFNIWLVKTDLNGHKIWDKVFGCGNFSEVGDIIETLDGGYVFSGEDCNRSVLLYKIDANGNTIWEKTFFDGFFGRGTSVQQTNDGGYIMAGYIRKYGRSNDIAVLAKTDANGNLLWQRKYGGYGSYNLAFSVDQTDDSGYILTGVTALEIGKGHADVLLIKTDSIGEVEWGYYHHPID